jgi:hypothetical protein
VLCYYLNAVCILERLAFVPLDAATAVRTEAAMFRRHGCAAEQAYEVAVTLCCDKIATLMGTALRGNKKVAYDIERGRFVCAQTPSARDEEEEEDFVAAHERDTQASLAAVVAEATGDEVGTAVAMRGRSRPRTRAMEDRKHIRNERRAFGKIPCGQPVLIISLRGRALVWNGSTQVMFCPSCGALHIYNILHFSQSPSGAYMCAECIKRTALPQPPACAYCRRQASESLPVLCVGSDPTQPDFAPALNPEHVRQQLYFCRSHYHVARRFCVDAKLEITKTELWQILARVTNERAKLRAAGLGHVRIRGGRTPK